MFDVMGRIYIRSNDKWMFRAEGSFDYLKKFGIYNTKKLDKIQNISSPDFPTNAGEYIVKEYMGNIISEFQIDKKDIEKKYYNEFGKKCLLIDSESAIKYKYFTSKEEGIQIYYNDKKFHNGYWYTKESFNSLIDNFKFNKDKKIKEYEDFLSLLTFPIKINKIKFKELMEKRFGKELEDELLIELEDTIEIDDFKLRDLISIKKQEILDIDEQIDCANKMLSVLDFFKHDDYAKEFGVEDSIIYIYFDI